MCTRAGGVLCKDGWEVGCAKMKLKSGIHLACNCATISQVEWNLLLLGGIWWWGGGGQKIFCQGGES